MASSSSSYFYSSSSSSFDSSSSSSFDSSSSSSSSSSFIPDESTSSGDFPIFGVTYYNDFRDVYSINNPIVDNETKMRFSGFFDKDWTIETREFDQLGYGLKKTKNSQGAIFCDDASKLFGGDVGYLSFIISFPYRITNGVYSSLGNQGVEFDEYILWGVNVGEHEISQPGLYASFTSSGTEFTACTPSHTFSIRDTTTTIPANTNIFYEFAWNIDGLLDDPMATMVMRVNNEVVASGNAPLFSMDMSNLNFYALDTPFTTNNIECTIRKLVTFNEIPDFFVESSE